MKKVFFTLAALCLTFVLSGCAGLFETNNLSLYGNPESSGLFGVRGGTELWENLEIGASANYQDTDTTITKTRYRRRKETSYTKAKRVEGDDWMYGAHVIQRFGEGDIVPYVGGQVNIGEGSDDVVDTLEPIGGVTLWDFLFVEYQRETLHGEDDKVVAGIRLKF